MLNIKEFVLLQSQYFKKREYSTTFDHLLKCHKAIFFTYVLFHEILLTLKILCAYESFGILISL